MEGNEGSRVSPRHTQTDSAVAVGGPNAVAVGRTDNQRVIDTAAAAQHAALIVFDSSIIVFSVHAHSVARGPLVSSAVAVLTPLPGIAVDVKEPQVVRLEPPPRPIALVVGRLA